MLEVRLNPERQGPRLAWLSELRGQDELDVAQGLPGVVTDVVDRLLVAGPRAALRPGDVAGATIADRDRLVAALYASAFGDQIESRADCASCSQQFELGFSLSDLLSELDRRASVALAHYEPVGPGGDHLYELGTGVRFRLPTVADEQALASDSSPDALLARCVQMVPGKTGHAAAFSGEAVEVAMEALAPVLSLALPARCAHCGHGQEIDFDVVDFFLAALRRERPLFVREVHTLACTYGWSYGEIVRLPRGERRAYVEAILSEREGTELGR
jgi:hypothetical protein